MKKSVVAIGNFDGVHLGHRDLLHHARALANKNNLNLTILTFTPHPRSVFQPNIAPFRITSDAVKNDIFMNDIQPDHYHVLDFTTQLSHKSADDFITDIIIGECNAAIVCVGRDFHFGHNRGGNLVTLQSRQEFQTVAADLIDIGDDVVSSTRIRNHLKSAEILQANALLGWEWFIQSTVVHGDKRGRTLGYPTANMHFGETIVPAHGVYAVRVQIEGEENKPWRMGAANIGIRPMFETAMPMLETYIFDFNDDIYGKTLKIMPVQKLRNEMKFDSLDALIVQMGRDCDVARKMLQH
jgi:riboflavin kinase / FMN adenylyltransferase